MLKTLIENFSLMKESDITSTPAFQSRLLRSEQWRAGLLGFVWVTMLLVWLLRRLLGGNVASTNAVFFPGITLLTFGVLFEGMVFFYVHRQSKLNKPQETGSSTLWFISAVVDLAIPIIYLVIVQKFSPRGAYAALSSPVLLVLPIVTMLCILRLRPTICLFTGFGAGLSHAGLTIMAINSAGIDSSNWPLLFTYGLILIVTGIIAAVIARQVRAYVTQAVSEAIEVEKTHHELAGLEHDMSIARDIQMSLMPSVAPSIPGFVGAGMARPAQQAGGDYYDWQQMPDGRLVVALADVSGHGIGPALVMAVCRAYARATAPSTSDPEALLAQINHLVFDDIGGTGRFITMAIAILSPDGTVELVSAGHGPTLLYHAASGKISTFNGNGIPLGIDSTELYRPHAKLKMEPGDVLLLLTDGLVEWARATDKKQFGEDRLSEALSGCATLPAQSILSVIDAAVISFAAGAPQMDDTTAVVIRRV